MTLVTDCITLDLPTLQDPRGDLTFIEGTIGNRKGHLPFEIRRIYYLYNVPGSSMRGGHAHLSLHQYAIAMAGSFDMVMDDGRKRQRLHLDSAHQALYIPPMIWHELENFSPGSICLVLASDIYDEADYVRNYREFLAMIESLESETMGNCVSTPPPPASVPATVHAPSITDLGPATCASLTRARKASGSPPSLSCHTP